MKNEQVIWKVKETSCFPNKWKVYPSKGKEENGLIYFHTTKEEAQSYADKLNTLFIEMHNHIGQVKENEADAEISRLEQSTGYKWRKDYTPFLEEVDNTEEIDAVQLSDGYCWIIKK